MNTVRYDYIVCRYGELVLKGKNRKEFINCLFNNTKTALSSFKTLELQKSHDGIFIHLNDEDHKEVLNRLKDIFGYSYFSAALRTERDLEDIKAKALMIADKSEAKTFKVIAKRNDKSFPYQSDAINRQVAKEILEKTDLKVNVHDPELKIFIRVKNDCAYVMDEKIRGLGGYPVGINHKALVMMSGGIDSPVAAFLTMKRGLKIECIHFASMPYTSKQALDKVLKLAKQISYYQNDIIVHVVPFTDLQLAIYKNVDEPYAITIMRRMMYRIADRLCQKRKIKVITNGESLGQVASQTVESLSVIGGVSQTLILRPLCMMDKTEIIDIAKAIDTYETSILPYEDCCTIFDPKAPITKPKEDKCLLYEKRFDYESLIQNCLDNIDSIKITHEDNDDEELF